MSEIIEWQRWCEDTEPPVDKPFLAWMGKDFEPWCVTLNAADDAGKYFTITGTNEFANADFATHWAPLPGGPS